jgi:YHS domain-containing protein
MSIDVGTKMKPTKLLIASTLIFLALSVQANESMVFSTDEGAIQGFDPVAYFKQDAAVKGRDDITHVWKGATWHFSSQANRDLFRSDPEAYAPAFGGYCAYSMTKGTLTPTQPQAFTIRNGVLYLNLSQAVRQAWLEDVSGNVSDALDNWLAFGAPE